MIKVFSTKKIQEFTEINLQEIVLGFNFDHSNVLAAKGHSFHFDQDLWCEMETSLESKIQKNYEEMTPFTEKEIVKYFYGITCGLEYLHSRGIVHRDIKLDSILIDKDDQIKIEDFRIVKYMKYESDEALDEIMGTPAYLAPELRSKNLELKNRDQFKADIWSLGVTILELCRLKKRIFANIASERIFAKIEENFELTQRNNYNPV